MGTQGKNLKMDTAEIEANKKELLERIKLYKSYGFDQLKSREFVVRKSRPIKGGILEIGTGKGYLTTLLAKEAQDIITVDISDEDQKFAALNIAAEGSLDKVKFTICDARKLPYPDKEFDLVISANAFHHFEHPFAVLKEMIRVCGKKLVIADFSREGFNIIRKVHRNEGHEHEEQHGDFGIVGVYLKENGFSVKRFEAHCQIVYAAVKKKGVETDAKRKRNG